MTGMAWVVGHWVHAWEASESGEATIFRCCGRQHDGVQERAAVVVPVIAGQAVAVVARVGLGAKSVNGDDTFRAIRHGSKITADET